MHVPDYWIPFLYQYGVGLFVFVAGLFIILRHRSCNVSRRDDRFWLGVLIFGFIWYAGIHFLWYMAALHLHPALPGGAA